MVWLSVYGISRRLSDRAGPSAARRGATSRSPSSALPVKATRTEITYRPRRCGGSAGMSGYTRAERDDVSASGTVRAQSVYARSTAPASAFAPSKASEPPYSRATGTRAISRPVTTPRFAPPPSRPRKSSGSASAETVRRCASAVTTSSDRT